MIPNEKKTMPNNIYIGSSIIVSLILATVFTYLNRNFELDDALIYYRYLQNFLDGYGLVYNIGERFNGLTSPLYTYISIIAVLVMKNVHLSQQLLSGFFLFLSGIALIPLLWKKIPAKIIVFAPLVIVSSYYFYITFGLETTLFSFLTIMTVWFYQEQRYDLLGISSALLLLTRGESLLLLLTIILFHFIEKRKMPSLQVFIIPAVILISHYLFNHFYYGAWMPETLAAKIGQGKSGLWGEPPVFLHQKKEFIQTYFNKNYFLMAMLAVTAGIGIFRNRKNNIVQILSIYFILYNGFYILLNIPNYPWYFSYHFLYMYIMVILGIHEIYKYMLASRFVALKAYSYYLAFIVFLAIFIPQTTYSYSRLLHATGLTNYQMIGRWIDANTEKNAKIACVEIGTIGWYSKRYIIDILGLVNQYNAEFISERKFDEWLNHYQPDYMLGHIPFWSHEVSIRKAMEEKKFVPVEGFRFEGYILLRKNPDGMI